MKRTKTPLVLDGFLQPKQKKINSNADSYVPLAERQRPKKLEDIIGQETAVGLGTPFNSMIMNDKIQSTILFGPPGCGKTTIAKIIKSSTKYFFVQISAVSSSKDELKSEIEKAKERKKKEKLDTLLFVDEIHALNKLQQDTFLPAIENGTIILIGATTENPSFKINNALMSRCTLVCLNRLEIDDIMKIMRKGINEEYSNSRFDLDDNCLRQLATFADGDARVALNSLESVFNYFNSLNDNEIKDKFKGDEIQPIDLDATEESTTEVIETKKDELEELDLSAQNEDPKPSKIMLTSEIVMKYLKKHNFQYDRNGEEHHNAISALHKSMRGGDEDAAIYWLGRMIFSGENPKYVARRMIRFATEDIGLADTNAVAVSLSAFRAVEILGYPECKTSLAECCLYLTRAKKSTAIYKATIKTRELVKKQPSYVVPLSVISSSERCTDINKDVHFLPEKLKNVELIEYDRFVQPVDKKLIEPSIPSLPQQLY